MTKAPQPIDLLFVLSPHALLLDVAGPAEAFRLADQHRVAQGLGAPFRLRFVGPVASTVSSVGLTIGEVTPLPRSLDGPTWVILPGHPTPHLGKVTPATEAITRWLRDVVREPLLEEGSRHRLLSICAGSLLAARAGLLQHRRCTTHHEVLGALRALAPRAEVLENRVFVVDGPIASCAGVTAGIDLALHYITQECGEALATTVAEDMVVYFRRAGSDPEASPFLAQRHHLHAAVHRVQDAILRTPRREWDMAMLAGVANTTERHLHRLFIDHAGISPLQYLRSIRLERARQSLLAGTSVSRAAEVAGFTSDLQLRRAWGRQWGGSPRDVNRTAGARRVVP